MRPNYSFRKDIRLKAALLVVLVVPVAAWLLEGLPAAATKYVSAPAKAAADDPFAGLRPADQAGREGGEASEEDEPLSAPPRGFSNAADQAVFEARQLIRAKKFEDAIRRLDAERDALRRRPDAYVQLGRAIEGRGDAATARDFFAKAIDMNPLESEAYWGYATASEALGDLESALGAMRSFLHTNPNPDPKRLRIAQARSAIWEWESQLGRGPWGPTKGVLPGLKPEQQRRDGRGIGIMMPLPETKQADGSMKFEIKHQKKFKLFDED